MLRDNTTLGPGDIILSDVVSIICVYLFHVDFYGNIHELRLLGIGFWGFSLNVYAQLFESKNCIYFLSAPFTFTLKNPYSRRERVDVLTRGILIIKRIPFLIGLLNARTCCFSNYNIISNNLFNILFDECFSAYIL